MRFRTLAVALDQMIKIVLVRIEVPLGIHRHEAGELQKSGQTLRMCPGYLAGTRRMTLFSNQSIFLSVAKALTDVGFLRVSIGPPIIVMRQRRRLSVAAMSEMAASTGAVGWQTEMTCNFRAEKTDEFQYVRDVVPEMERPFRQGHHPSILPVGDVDVVVLNESADGVARGLRSVRKRRHHQDLRLLERPFTLEMQQRAERLLEDLLLGHRHRLAVDHGLGQAELRLG